MSEVRNALFAWGSTSRMCTCRGCGCTDSHACPGGCTWVLLDIDAPSGICSKCAEEYDWNPILLNNAGEGGMTADDIREQLRGAI